MRSFTTENSQGLVAGLEYTDKKSEVHALKVSFNNYVSFLNIFKPKFVGIYY